MRQSEIQELKKSKGSKQSRAADRNKPVLSISKLGGQTLVNGSQLLFDTVLIDDYHMLQFDSPLTSSKFIIPRTGKYEILIYLDGLFSGSYQTVPVFINTYVNNINREISPAYAEFSALLDRTNLSFLVVLDLSSGDSVAFFLTLATGITMLTGCKVKINLLR